MRITRAIEIAHHHGIGVLLGLLHSHLTTLPQIHGTLDLHAAPGKQNNDAHAGTSDPPTFFSKINRKHTIHVLRILLSALHSLSPRLPNIIGIELVNEPSPPSLESHTILKDWYATAIKELHTLDPSMPIYIGDCWCTDEYAEFIDSLPQEKNSLVVLDHHLYQCFTVSDIHTPADMHAQSLSNPSAPTPQTLARVSEKLGRAKCGAGLVIGEWSGALNPGSMTGKAGEGKRYVEAQLGLYEKTCAGWFFWTFKKQEEGDVGWSFRDAVQGGVVGFMGLKAKDKYLGIKARDQERRRRAREVEANKGLGRPFPRRTMDLLTHIMRSCTCILLVAVPWEICAQALQGGVCTRMG